jgi:multidrug efflux pump subunit AcrB
MQAAIDDMRPEPPRSATVTLTGQAPTMQLAYVQLLEGLALSIILVFLVIVVNFQSWLDPLVVISALPAALAGADFRFRFRRNFGWRRVLRWRTGAILPAHSTNCATLV